MILWLIGMMGTGKSTAGRLAAERASVTFFDTDEEVERIAGAPVSQIWEDLGEEGFRRLESQVVTRVGHEDRDAIVATGGGAIVNPANQTAMRSSGKSVWLQASSATLQDRLGTLVDRPLLGGIDDRTAFLGQIIEERAQHYSDLADFTIVVDEMSSAGVADAVVEIWKNS